MNPSLISQWKYVCNCGPDCDCNFRSELPSQCPCGKPAVRRRILAEDEHNFYVAQTGDKAEGPDALGDQPFTSASGQPLQGFRKAWQERERTVMYRGMQVKLVQSDLECTVSIEGKDFKANKHDERGIVGWMGYPCYLMFESPEKYARALVDDWDIIGNEKILAPPVHDDSHSHDNH